MKVNNMLLVVCFMHAGVLATWHHPFQIKQGALFSRILSPIFELAMCYSEWRSETEATIPGSLLKWDTVAGNYREA